MKPFNPEYGYLNDSPLDLSGREGADRESYDEDEDKNASSEPLRVVIDVPEPLPDRVLLIGNAVVGYSGGTVFVKEPPQAFETTNAINTTGSDLITISRVEYDALRLAALKRLETK